MGDQTGWVRANLRAMVPLPQNVSSTCWRTCYEMLYNWAGLDPSSIPDLLKAAGIDYGSSCITGLLDDDFSPAAMALGLSPLRFKRSISASDLKQYLTKSPLWLAGKWYPSAKHVRIVTGASDEYVEYFDPWWSGGKLAADLTHQEIIDGFLHGDGKSARGTDAQSGTFQMSYWTPGPDLRSQPVSALVPLP
jgi:hypothetical protein